MKFLSKALLTACFVCMMGIIPLGTTSATRANILGRESFSENVKDFLNKFSSLSKLYVYDEQHAINNEKEQDLWVGSNIYLRMKAACQLLDTTRRGICRTFSFKLASELNKRGLGCYIIINPEHRHCANIYWEPKLRKYLVADLTMEMAYSDDKGYDSNTVALGRFPFEKYIQIFWKGDFKNTKVIVINDEESSPSIFSLKEFLNLHSKLVWFQQHKYDFYDALRK